MSLQCVAQCAAALQRVAACMFLHRYVVAVCCTVCSSVLQCVAACMMLHSYVVAQA